MTRKLLYLLAGMFAAATTFAQDIDFISRLEAKRVKGNLFLLPNNGDSPTKKMLWFSDYPIGPNDEQFLDSRHTYFHTKRNRISLNLPFYNPTAFKIIIKDQIYLDPIIKSYDSLVNMTLKVLTTTVPSTGYSTSSTSFAKAADKLNTKLVTYVFDQNLKKVVASDGTEPDSTTKLETWELETIFGNLKQQNFLTIRAKLFPYFSDVEAFYINQDPRTNKISALMNEIAALKSAQSGRKFQSEMDKFDTLILRHKGYLKQYKGLTSTLVADFKNPVMYIRGVSKGSTARKDKDGKEVKADSKAIPTPDSLTLRLMAALALDYQRSIKPFQDSLDLQIAAVMKFRDSLKATVARMYGNLKNPTTVNTIDYYKLQVEDHLPTDSILDYSISIVDLKSKKSIVNQELTFFSSAAGLVISIQPGIAYLFRAFNYSSFNVTNNVVTQTNSSTRYKPVIFFNFYTRLGDGWYLMPLQLGITAANSLPGILTGGGLSYKGRFTVSFGASFFANQSLGSDLKVGDPAPKDAIGNHINYFVDKNHPAYFSLTYRIFKGAL